MLTTSKIHRKLVHIYRLKYEVIFYTVKAYTKENIKKILLVYLTPIQITKVKEGLYKGCFNSGFMLCSQYGRAIFAT